MENEFKEAPDDTMGLMFKATVTDLKGSCRANHRIGQQFQLNCYDTGGLCGFFYHDLYPYLLGLQYGAEFPWWGDQKLLEIECPDPYNKLVLLLERPAIPKKT
jgi:uncharacterized repeat protein (TIGR04076 family)